jgi:hypothetical protein
MLFEMALEQILHIDNINNTYDDAFHVHLNLHRALRRCRPRV